MYDTFGEEDHLVHRDRQGIVVSANDIAGTVADKQHVDAGFVHKGSKGEIITGQHGDLLAVGFHLTQFSRRHSAVLNVNAHDLFLF